MTPAQAKIKHWRENPQAFAWDNFKIDLDEWQKDGLTPCGGVPNPRRRLMFAACTGPGKRAHPQSSWNTFPPYSTDIAAAWEVVKTMNGLGWVFDLIQGVNECHSPWRAHFLKDDIRTNGYSDTAPHAICLAALKAVGVELS